MRPFGWTIALAACILAVPMCGAGAQTKARRPAPRTTLSGVYTAEQAARGRYVYAVSCRSCHSAASHTGAMFASWWKGKTLSDLFVWVWERMPKNDPGSLAPEDVADVVAYLLRMNEMPTGKVEIPPDSLPLKSIRIETVTKRTRQ